MTLTEAVQMTASSGVLAGGVGYAIRQVSTALAKRAEAKRLDSEAESRRAEAARIAAADDAVTNQQLRTWIDELRDEVAALRAANEECEKRSRQLAADLADLRRLLDGAPPSKVVSLVLAKEDAPRRAKGDER